MVKVLTVNTLENGDIELEFSNNYKGVFNLPLIWLIKD
jgi:hypothetical protein